MSWPKCPGCGRNPCECEDEEYAFGGAARADCFAEEQAELYDADELGLDPEDDDARKYGTGA